MLKSRIIEAHDDYDEIYDLFEEQGLIDGHPIVPPTVQRVEKFVRYCEQKLGRWGDEVLGEMPPALGETTIEKVATNAVMAGCRPEYMPLVIAAAELLVAYADQLLVGVGSHTKNLWMLINGPVRNELGIQTGEYGATGASWRANATIMRAVELLAFSCGGQPGLTGKKSFGWVGCYYHALAENEEASPWEPYHVERGFDPATSTVSLLNVEPPKHIEMGNWAYKPAELLAGFADSMSTVANRSSYGEYDSVIILGKDIANTLAAAWFSKADVKRFLYEHARTPYGKFGVNARDGFSEEWEKFYAFSPNALVPMVLMVTPPPSIGLRDVTPKVKHLVRKIKASNLALGRLRRDLKTARCQRLDFEMQSSILRIHMT